MDPKACPFFEPSRERAPNGQARQRQRRGARDARSEGAGMAPHQHRSGGPDMKYYEAKETHELFEPIRAALEKSSAHLFEHDKVRPWARADR